MFKLKSKLIIAVMLIFGITAFMSCKKEQVKTGINSNKVAINDAMIQKMADAHNEYLKAIVANYDFNNNKNKIENFKKNFLKTDLKDLSNSQKTTIINHLNKVTNKSTGESSITPVTIDNLIQKINSGNFMNKELLIKLIKNATDKVLNSRLTYSELSSFLDSLKNNSANKLDESESVILKTYFETLQASAYFWFPTELGGSGIGYAYLKKLNNNTKSSIGPLGSALISDASSMSIGMIGVAITGAFFGPIGWGALAVVAGESAANSGLAAVVAAM